MCFEEEAAQQWRAYAQVMLDYSIKSNEETGDGITRCILNTYRVYFMALSFKTHYVANADGSPILGYSISEAQSSLLRDMPYLGWTVFTVIST